MVVLNACESATESTAQSFMGLAPNLNRTGVPAVVAMQYPILDSHAVHFSRALYKALADGWPLDAAVTEGRKAIAAQITEDDMDWGIPVLFMRSNDGVLWKEKEEKMDQPKSIRTDSAPVTSSSDTITANISGIGSGAQVAVGKQIRQTIRQAPSGQSVSDVAEVSRLLNQLKSELAGLEIAEHKKIIGQEFVTQLEEELTKKEQQPDGSVIKVAGNWLLKNIPAITSTLAAIFLSPVVGKVVEAAGDIAVDWVKERFGG